jgi:hypothetical protein
MGLLHDTFVDSGREARGKWQRISPGPAANHKGAAVSTDWFVVTARRSPLVPQKEAAVYGMFWRFKSIGRLVARMFENVTKHGER